MARLDKQKLLDEVAACGISLSSINDLLKINKNHKALVPIILKYIEQVDDEGDKELLVRCLGVKGFTEATNALIGEFHRSTNSTYKWAIGNTLSIICDPNSLQELEAIARDVKHGTARQMVVVAIGKLKNSSSIPLLVQLLDDEEVVGHAIMALSNFKEPSLLRYIRPLAGHKTKWVSREAQKMIKKLDVQPSGE